MRCPCAARCKYQGDGDMVSGLKTMVILQAMCLVNITALVHVGFTLSGLERSNVN